MGGDNFSPVGVLAPRQSDTKRERRGRIEAGIHSLFEVFLGGLLGALVTLVIFQVFWA